MDRLIWGLLNIHDIEDDVEIPHIHLFKSFFSLSQSKDLKKFFGGYIQENQEIR